MEKFLSKIDHSLLFLFVSVFFAINAYPQTGKIVREIVHSKSLENTVTKENPRRNVSIYLPPSYSSSPEKRYPVIYLLHGIQSNDRQSWTTSQVKGAGTLSTIQDVMNHGIKKGKFGEMIIVMPDEITNLLGSYYVNSKATGNWEDFTVKELVNYIDSKYRTIARAESRGIAGHSMGGHGAFVLGMKFPKIFSTLYGMNSAFMGWNGEVGKQNPAFMKVLEIGSMQELFQSGSLPVAITIVARAFSPNPDKPPFFADFPFKMENGKLVPSEPAFSKWEANFPINMVGRYKKNLKKLRGIRFDSSFDDEFKFIPLNSRALSKELEKHKIEHIYEEYNGDHSNRLWGKNGRMITELLPYFWDHLDKTALVSN